MQDPLPTKRVHNLIIVNESGSMSIIRKQAFTGMNETLQTVRQMQKKFPDLVQFVTKPLWLFRFFFRSVNVPSILLLVFGIPSTCWYVKRYGR